MGETGAVGGRVGRAGRCGRPSEEVAAGPGAGTGVMLWGGEAPGSGREGVERTAISC